MEVKRVIKEVEDMEYDELMEVLDAVILRWKGMFPGWEIFSVSIPQDDCEALRRSTDMIIRLIEEKKTQNVTHIAPKGDPDPKTAHKNLITFPAKRRYR